MLNLQYDYKPRSKHVYEIYDMADFMLLKSCLSLPD